MHAVAKDTCWEARISLGFRLDAGRSMLSERSHQGPLRIQRPFYPEGPGVCHVYLLHPPGGVVCSDRLDIHIHVDERAHGLLTTPGAGKFYRSTARRCARQHQHLRLERSASLEWLPQENIFYEGTRCELLTRVDLQRGSRFIGWEINCLGRPASGETFRKGRLRQRFELWRDGTPLWLERNLFDESAVLNAAWGLQGQPVAATLVCTPADRPLVDSVRNGIHAGADGLFAATLADDVLVCRYLGRNGQAARACLTAAWQCLRPAVLGRPASPPRIWNT